MVQDFSATSNSSGTMTSELLADYEEGTWTPGISFGGGQLGITYTTQSWFLHKDWKPSNCLGIYSFIRQKVHQLETLELLVFHTQMLTL
jgi:hypothetical protein